MRKVNSLSPFKLGPQTSYRVLLPAEPSHQNLKVGIITLANYYFEKKTLHTCKPGKEESHQHQQYSHSNALYYIF